MVYYFTIKRYFHQTVFSKRKKKNKNILLSDLGTYTLGSSLMYDKVEHKNLQFLAIDPKRVSI